MPECQGCSVSGRVWEDYVCVREGVGVGEVVRGCQGDGQECASLLEGEGTVSTAPACVTEGHEVVIL